MELMTISRMGDEQLLKLLSDMEFIVNRDLYQNNFFEFFKAAWSSLESSDYEYAWFHEYLCEWYQYVVLHDGKVTLNVNLPPRHLKSMIFSICGPVWSWAKFPYLRYIQSSYSDPLSTTLSIKRRDLINSEWYRANWSDSFRLKLDRNTQTRFANDKLGEMLSTSVGGSITGEGCHILINDDPMKPAHAYSDAERLKSVDHHKNTLQSRFNDKRKAKQIIVMQRIHREDLSGEISDRKNVINIVLPVQNKTKSTLTFRFPLSGKVKRMKPNEYLSKRMGKSEVEDLFSDMTRDQVEAQYFQNPNDTGGAIVKSEYIKHWSTLPNDLLVTLSIDCTFKGDEGKKGKAKTDYVAIHAWATSPSNPALKYLVDRLRGRWDIVKTMQMMAIFAQRYPKYRKFLIEDKANGPAIITLLKNKIARLTPVNPRDSKIERLVAITPDFEAGNILFPPENICPWVKTELIPQVTQFPKVKNDDDVDSMTQAILDIRSSEKNNYRALIDGLKSLGNEISKQ